MKIYMRKYKVALKVSATIKTKIKNFALFPGIYYLQFFRKIKRDMYFCLRKG